MGTGEMLFGTCGGEKSVGEDEDRTGARLVVECCVGGEGGGGEEWECGVGDWGVWMARLWCGFVGGTSVCGGRWSRFVKGVLVLY